MRALTFLCVSALALLCLLDANAETFVTKDGKIYVGTTVMDGKNAITVRTKEGTVTLSKRDLLELTPEEAAARVLLSQGEQAKAKADTAYQADDLGRASYYYRASLAALGAIGEGTKEQFAAASRLMEQAKARAEKLQATLDQRGLTEYRGQLFKPTILQDHLSEEHVLVGKGIWVMRSQICDVCASKGRTPCATCSGAGAIPVRCPYCQSGRIPNPRSNGTAKAICTTCGGRGRVAATCATCRGRGKVLCGTCRAKGLLKERCVHCKGRGYISVPTIEYDNRGHLVEVRKRIECAACNRKGYLRVQCPTCGGTKWATCGSCGGTGKRGVKCRDCAGLGYVAVPSTVPCPRCHQGGVQKACPTCGARGYTTCTKCDGKGYTGDPCPDPEPPRSDTEEQESSPDESGAP